MWKWILVYILFINLFNLTYLSNCGLFVVNWKSSIVTYKQRPKIYSKHPSSLSEFRFDPLLSEKECKILTERIYAHKHKWQKRNSVLSTLGVASYLDGSDKLAYVRESEISNQFLAHEYDDIHSIVLEYYRSLVKCEVDFRENAALPGFHVFHCNSTFSMPVASVHTDQQFARLTYDPEESIDYSNTLSFTLCLELPTGGGGLYVFSSDFGLLNYIFPKALSLSLETKKKIEYKVGWIVSHNGSSTHMIAPCKPSKTNRITLQGHGVYDKRANKWWLYW